MDWPFDFFRNETHPRYNMQQILYMRMSLLVQPSLFSALAKARDRKELHMPTTPLQARTGRTSPRGASKGAQKSCHGLTELPAVRLVGSRYKTSTDTLRAFHKISSLLEAIEAAINPWIDVLDRESKGNGSPRSY